MFNCCELPSQPHHLRSLRRSRFRFGLDLRASLDIVARSGTLVSSGHEKATSKSRLVHVRFGFRLKTYINVFGSTTDTTVMWAAQWKISKLKHGINKALRSAKWH